MTIQIEINEKMVERMGYEIAEMMELMDSLSEDIKMLDRRVQAMDGIHDDLIDAVNHSKAENAEPVDLSEVHEAEEHLAKMKKKYGLS